MKFARFVKDNLTLSDIGSLSKAHVRSDVQGLRGIAVGLVVAYHLGLPVTGGFIGVDIFFVISGFVISKLIIREFESSSKFSFKKFYGRRIRRILPIYGLVAFTTLVLAQFFLSPFGEIQQVTSTGFWSASLAANEQLMREDSYLGLVENPLRHLWSLAVEEQFYLFFPVLFVLYLRTAQRSTRSEDLARRILWTFFFASMLLSIVLSHSTSDSLKQFAFFSVFTRSWQFLAGVAVAIYVENSYRISQRGKNFLAGISSLGLCWSLFTAVEQRDYPGFWALAPTLATSALLIASSSNSISHKFLSLRPLTLLGDLSYGVYLWHWPIIVFVQRYTEINFEIGIAIVVVTLFISFITFRLVERPFREWDLNFRESLAMACLIVIVLITGSTFSNEQSKRIQERAFSPQIPQDNQLVRFGLGVRDTILNSSDVCHSPNVLISELISVCSNGVKSNKPEVLILGDSHAAAIGDGLFEAGRLRGVGVVGYFEYGCSMVPDVGLVSEDTCEKFRRRSREIVLELRPKIVVVAQSFSVYVTGEQAATTVISPSEGVPMSSQVRKVSRELISRFRLQMEQFVLSDQLLVLFEEVPFAIMPGTKTQDEFLAHERLRLLLTNNLHSEFQDNRQVKFIDPESGLCPISPPCAFDADGKLIYFHKTHLNQNGSLRLTDEWLSLFEEQLK